MLVPSKEWKHFAAMVLIGDGVMAMVCPKRDAEAWNAGPRFWRRFMRVFRDSPNLTRLIGASQVIAGVWWAASQEDRCR